MDKWLTTLANTCAPSPQPLCVPSPCPPSPPLPASQAEGNSFFKSGDYAKAIEKYVLATSLDGTVPAYWSNMAASHEKLGSYAEMEQAARSCVKADSKFVKGYFRLATALKAQGKNAECIKTLEVSSERRGFGGLWILLGGSCSHSNASSQSNSLSFSLSLFLSVFFSKERPWCGLQ